CPGLPRRTASKLTVPVTVTRGGKTATFFVLSSAASGRKAAAQELRRLLGGDPAVKQVDEALDDVLARAYDLVTRPAGGDGGLTVRQVLEAGVPEALKLAYRTERGGAWSELYGREVSRAEFCTYTPDWLLQEAGAASDVPHDFTGQPVRLDLLRLV